MTAPITFVITANGNEVTVEVTVADAEKLVPIFAANGITYRIA
jgi:hypothetical protein